MVISKAYSINFYSWNIAHSDPYCALLGTVYTSYKFKIGSGLLGILTAERANSLPKKWDSDPN